MSRGRAGNMPGRGVSGPVVLGSQAAPPRTSYPLGQNRHAPVVSSPALTPHPLPYRLTAAPHWYADLGELHLGSRLVKRYRRRAQNQFAILAAFEAQGWPLRIDNPLRTDLDGDGPERLHDAIKRLNLRQTAPLLRFRGDGTAQGVLWEATSRSVEEHAT